MNSLRLGTRRSALAQVQSRSVAKALEMRFPGLTVELVLITTSGDRSSALQTPGTAGPGGLKAMFTKELEDALLANEIDVAVHSLKDMAVALPTGLIIAAFPEREDVRDAWISKSKTPFHALQPKTRVGTGAVRRRAQLKHLNPSLDVVPLRGNVDTRLGKLSDGNLDGIILAVAGLKRLSRAQEITEILPVETMVPAIGQGCLALQCRLRDTRTNDFLAPLDHAATRQAVLAERALLRGLGGSCQTPIAGYARTDGETLSLAAVVASPDGETLLRDEERGSVNGAEALGQRLAERLLSKGADRLLQPSAS